MHMLLAVVLIAVAAREPQAGPAGESITGHVVGVMNGHEMKPQPILWVYAKSTHPRRRAKKDLPKKEITQRDIKFDPNVVMVPTGTVINFSNHEDSDIHNVFSPDPFFDLDRYGPKATKPHKFDVPDEISIYCDIHPCMWARVKVVDVPGPEYIARVGADGNYTLTGLSEGTYVVSAWTANSKEQSSDEVTVAAGKTAKATDIHVQVGPSPGSTKHDRKDSTPYPVYDGRCPQQ